MRKLIIAIAALAMLAVPAIAQSNWVVIERISTGECFVAPRAAAVGEQQVAGLFVSKALAEEAMEEALTCQIVDDSEPDDAEYRNGYFYSRYGRPTEFV